MNHARVRSGRIRGPVLAIVMGLATTLLGACGPSGLGSLAAQGLPAVKVKAGTVTDTERSESARDVRTSATAEEQAAPGIVAKHSSKFVGAVFAPPGIIAKNSSKFRIAAFQQVPFARGLVVLMTPDGFYYLDAEGQPVTATTDESGRYDFGDFRIPAGQNVLVAASFPGNRVLYRYARSEAGDNHVDVDTAGTYVSAYLVARSRRLGRTLESFDAASLGKLHDLTGKMLEAGTLGFNPDLFTMPRAGDLVATYQTAFRASPDLAAAWDALLGQ